MPTQLIMGNSLIQDGISSFDCWRSRKEPIDVLQFSLKNQLQINVEKKAPVEFYLGLYGGEIKKVFKGYIENTTAPFLARDKMSDLMSNPIMQSFERVLPQEVLGFGLQKSGVNKMALSSEKFARKNFVAAAPTFYDLMVQVNKAWDVNYDGYFDLEESFHWHPPIEQSKLPVFSYGENIINISFDGTQGSLLTILVPELDHSQLIGIEYPNIPENEFMVDTVHHFTNDVGGLRTEVFFSIP